MQLSEWIFSFYVKSSFVTCLLFCFSRSIMNDDRLCIENGITFWSSTKVVRKCFISFLSFVVVGLFEQQCNIINVRIFIVFISFRIILHLVNLKRKKERKRERNRGRGWLSDGIFGAKWIIWIEWTDLRRLKLIESVEIVELLRKCETLMKKFGLGLIRVVLISSLNCLNHIKRLIGIRGLIEVCHSTKVFFLNQSFQLKISQSKRRLSRLNTRYTWTTLNGKFIKKSHLIHLTISSIRKRCAPISPT